MYAVAYAVARGVWAVQGRHNSKVTALVLGRGMSRTATIRRQLRLASIGQPSRPCPPKKPIHSSAETRHSTSPLSMEQQHLEGAVNHAITPPSAAQLKVLFTASAVPMIGFGIMDNLVMIQAGQFIDNTIGVTMGLATMTAAAAGQVVSDVSGVIFGGSLERFLHKHKLIQSSTLTTAQRSFPIARNVAMFGAVCGVALGCGVGASCLLFMDLEARERTEHAIQLQGVLNDMMTDAGSEESGGLHCESCTIHLANVPAEKHFSINRNNDGKTKIDLLPKTQQTGEMGKFSMAVQAARDGKSILNDTGSVLCTPIFSGEGQVVAVLEFCSKKDSVRGFTTEDEKAAKVMARHIGIFMHRLID